jgi:hypothetical protein
VQADRPGQELELFCAHALARQTLDQRNAQAVLRLCERTLQWRERTPEGEVAAPILQQRFARHPPGA